MTEDRKTKFVGPAATSAADALKLAMGGSLASDALKLAGITSSAREALKIAGISGLKPELLASIGKITAPSDALKSAGVGRLNTIVSPSIGAAGAAVDALRAASAPSLSGVLDATRHLADGRYAVTVSPSRGADSLKQVEGGVQRERPVARMQVPRPIRSPEALGQMVRQAREAMGLTQMAFADAAGVGRRFVSELENGKPTLELGKVMAVCAAAGLDLLAAPR